MANPLMNLAFQAFAQRSTARLIQHVQQIEQAQETFLRSLLQSHQDTEFGLEHKLSEIKTIDQFRLRLPIRPYSAFAPYIQRMAHGEANVLVPDPLIYFNISSGSTGQKKFIPVTARSRRFLSRSSRTAIGFAIKAALRDQRPLGKILFPMSVNPHGQTASGISYAPVSTSDMYLMDGLSRNLLFVHPPEAYQIADTTARYYICLMFALRDPNLRVILATFPILALQMCRQLEEHADSLIQDIEVGQIADWIKLEPQLRERLERKWSAAPRRAAQLRQIYQSCGRLTPQTAWSGLSLMVTARAGTSNFYFEQFPEYFGDLPIFGGIYACSEGNLGVHYDFNTDNAIPAIESTLIEFVPEDQWETDCPKTLMAWELEVGRRYRIVLTNYSGFYRYDLGDVVEIEGFFEQAPLMRFLHRRGGVISASTEKTTEAHVLATMQQLQKIFQVTLENFCITLPKKDLPAYYLVNIELSPADRLADPEKFLQQFEVIMQSVQKFYAIKRRDQIAPPRLRILPSGSFEILRQRMIQRGISAAQIKFPHVTEDRQWLDGLSIEQEVRLE